MDWLLQPKMSHQLYHSAQIVSLVVHSMSFKQSLDLELYQEYWFAWHQLFTKNFYLPSLASTIIVIVPSSNGLDALAMTHWHYHLNIDSKLSKLRVYCFDMQRSNSNYRVCRCQVMLYLTGIRAWKNHCYPREILAYFVSFHYLCLSLNYDEVSLAVNQWMVLNLSMALRKLSWEH